MIYALNENDTLVHVDKVPNGNACGCKCPSCKKPLMARHGLKRRHSFAHQSNQEKCVFGLQTSLHLLAKEIIKEGCEIKLPPVMYGSEAQYIDENDYEELQKPLYEAKTIVADDVFLEKRVDDFIPDIIVMKNNKSLIVEIYVTHPVDDEKKKRIEKANISAIEFDLSKIDRDIDKEVLNDIFKKGSNCEWIYNTHSAKKTAEFNLRMGQKKKELEEKKKREIEQKEKKKQENIAKYGGQLRYYKIYGGFDSEYIYNPPCKKADIRDGKRIKYISGCHLCDYFIKYENGKLWCQRERYYKE